MLVIAGLGLIGASIVYSEKTGQMQQWDESLGIDKAPQYITAGLLIGGIALIALGAIAKNALMVVAGIGLLGEGVYFGVQSGTLKNWWDTLCLPEYSKWVTPALLVGGIALVVFGIVLKNILMILGGLALLAAGVTTGIESGTFQNWWDTLSLPEYANWIVPALLIGGIALIVIGAATGNIPMLIAGLGLLGAAITFGITSGTFSRWIDDIKTGLVDGWNGIKSWWNSNVAPKLTLSYWQDKFSVFKDALVDRIKAAVNSGIVLLNRFIDWVNDKLNISWDSFSVLGKEIIPSGSIQLFTIPHIPALATGAVIPPNPGIPGYARRSEEWQ